MQWTGEQSTPIEGLARWMHHPGPMACNQEGRAWKAAADSVRTALAPDRRLGNAVERGELDPHTAAVAVRIDGQETSSCETPKQLKCRNLWQFFFSSPLASSL